MSRPTQAERIASLETSLPMIRAEAQDNVALFMSRFDKFEEHILARLDAMAAKQEEDTRKSEERDQQQAAKLKSYEDKGRGVLIGVGILVSALTGGVLAGLHEFTELFR